MSIKEIYDNALLEQHKAESIVSSIKKEITFIIKGNVMNKYKDKILIRNNNEYKLHGVRVSTYSYGVFKKNGIDIELYFVCISNMAIQKKRALNLEIERFDNHGHMWETNHKIPILHKLSYEVELDSLLNSTFGLEIK